MPIAPRLEVYTVRKLKEINHHLEARWNRRFERWEIWFNPRGLGMIPPYILMNVSEITAETFNDLRKSFWYSQKGYKRLAQDMLYKAELRKRKALEDEDDLHYQMGKEVVPLLKSLKDAGTSSHGNSVFQFPGVGKGELNA